MRGFGSLREIIAERKIELRRDVARHLEVLLLIASDGDLVRVVDEDVGGHEHRVREEACIGREPFRDLVLVGRRALEEPHRRDGEENPEELGDLGNVGLAKERHVRVRWIEAEREVVERDVARQLAELVGVTHGGQRVEVRDEDEALVARRLKLEKLRNRAEVIAEVDLARGLDAGKNTHGEPREPAMVYP